MCQASSSHFADINSCGLHTNPMRLWYTIISNPNSRGRNQDTGRISNLFRFYSWELEEAGCHTKQLAPESLPSSSQGQAGLGLHLKPHAGFSHCLTAFSWEPFPPSITCTQTLIPAAALGKSHPDTSQNSTPTVTTISSLMLTKDSPALEQFMYSFKYCPLRNKCNVLKLKLC